MLERDRSEEGAFDQGRRNKEMKSKRVSESLLLPDAFSRHQENLWDLQQRALINSI